MEELLHCWDNTSHLRSSYLFILASHGHVCLSSQSPIRTGRRCHPCLAEGLGGTLVTSTQNPKLAKSSSHQLVRPWCDAKGSTRSRRWYTCSIAVCLMGLAILWVPLGTWWVIHQLLLLHGGHLIPVLLVSLYLGDLLGGCKRSIFPSIDDHSQCFPRTDLCFHCRWKTA